MPEPQHLKDRFQLNLVGNEISRYFLNPHLRLKLLEHHSDYSSAITNDATSMKQVVSNNKYTIC